MEREPNQTEEGANQIAGETPKTQPAITNTLLRAVTDFIESFDTKDKGKNGPNKAFGSGKIWG